MQCYFRIPWNLRRCLQLIANNIIPNKLGKHISYHDAMCFQPRCNVFPCRKVMPIKPAAKYFGMAKDIKRGVRLMFPKPW